MRRRFFFFICFGGVEVRKLVFRSDFAQAGRCLGGNCQALKCVQMRNATRKNAYKEFRSLVNLGWRRG
jgi:hypothetical protein